MAQQATNKSTKIQSAITNVIKELQKVKGPMKKYEIKRDKV